MQSIKSDLKEEMMNAKTAIGAMSQVPTYVVPPNGDEPYNQIDIFLELSEAGAIELSSVNKEDCPAVELQPGDPKGDPTLRITAYCLQTRILIHPPEGARFEGGSLTGGDEKISYRTETNGGALTIHVSNKNHVHSPRGNIMQLQDTTSFGAVLYVAEDKRPHLRITLIAPPYRQIKVHFDPGQPKQFWYEGDIDNSEIRMLQDGGIVFDLVSPSEGAEFDRLEPFYFEEKPGWIIDAGTNGKQAFMANLCPIQDSKKHSFRFKVNDQGSLYASDDPTIVNVEPSDPPGGRELHPGRGGYGAPERPAER